MNFVITVDFFDLFRTSSLNFLSAGTLKLQFLTV
jgi:hypothetical protein